MEYKLDYGKINKFVDKKGKYTYRRRLITNVLPLPTREPERARFDKGFISVVGGVARKINGKNVQVDVSRVAVDGVIQHGNFKGEESEALFTYYLTEQLKELNDGRISAFKQMEQIPFAENPSERKGEMDFVSFFYDTFIGDEIERVKEILQNIDDPDLISEILEFLTQDSANAKEQTQEMYKNFFPKLKEQFLRDLEALAQNQTFLLDNIADLFVHYTFVAMSQVILQTNKTTDFDEERLTPVYYILQWEKAARWRNCYKHGYKMLTGEMEGFFAHEHVLNIIGLNTFSEQRNLFYHDIKNILTEAGTEAESQFVQSVYHWLNEVYSVKTSIEVETFSIEKTIDDAFTDLLSAVRPGISKEINSRYQKAFEAIVTKFFRKHGGSLGTLLSLTQEQLLLLVAVSVGEERIELKQLWSEFENRGVWLDYHSKEEVVKILDKLNYMEKKSDSGDAQYVKSIL